MRVYVCVCVCVCRLTVRHRRAKHRHTQGCHSRHKCQAHSGVAQHLACGSEGVATDTIAVPAAAAVLNNDGAVRVNLNTHTHTHARCHTYTSTCQSRHRQTTGRAQVLVIRKACVCVCVSSYLDEVDQCVGCSACQGRCAPSCVCTTCRLRGCGWPCSGDYTVDTLLKQPLVHDTCDAHTHTHTHTHKHTDALPSDLAIPLCL